MSKSGRIVLDSDVGTFSYHFRSMGDGIDLFKFLANPLFKPDYVAEKLCNSAMRAYNGKELPKATTDAVEALVEKLLITLREKKI